jgi:predicted permease
MNDFRFAFRQLAKNPGFTAVAVLTLALCLGANLAIFAVVDSVLLRPLPFPESDRLVTLFNTYPKAGVDRGGASLPNYYERRGAIPAFSHISALRYDTAIVGETGSTEQEQVMRVSPDFFNTLGTGPKMGRAFTEAETTYQTDNVAILTDEYWREHFNSDPGVVGRQLRVDGLQRTIIGVLPAGFRFLSSKARLYFPLSSNPDDREAKQRHSNEDLELIARLQPGISLATAQTQIDAHNAAHAAEYPSSKMVAEAGFRTIVTPLHADHVKTVRPILLLTQAGVFFLLLIGGVNLVNLLLIRASSRTRELAIRQSLGASRWHVVRQVTTETVLLSCIGGLFGLAVGAAGVRVLSVLGAQQLPLGAHIAFDLPLALLALAAAVIFGMIIAGPVAWFNLRGHPADALQSETRGGTANPAAQRLRHSFIVAQISLAFVLVAGAGLLGLSLQHAMAMSPGFRPDHLLTGRISLPWKNYPDWTPRLTFIDRLLHEIKSQPGVSAAGVINNIPFSGENEKSAFTVEGHVRAPGESLQGHYFYGVGGDAFSALGIPLREGRFLGSADSDRRVCVVDEDFANRYWPKGGAIGQRLVLGAGATMNAEAFTVVGVVGAVKQAEITENHAQGAVYFSYKNRTVVNMFAVVRTSQRPESFALTLQKIVREIDPELPVSDVRSMNIRIADSLMVRRSPAMLTGIFAAVALLLAAIGTYGVLSYAVNQRRREIGVRMALGALPEQIGAQFLSIGLGLLAAGTVLGMMGAWIAGRAMKSILFNVPSMPLTTAVITVSVMSLVCLFASWLPARRAARIDPMEALRYE